MHLWSPIILSQLKQLRSQFIIACIIYIIYCLKHRTVCLPSDSIMQVNTYKLVKCPTCQRPSLNLYHMYHLLYEFKFSLERLYELVKFLTFLPAFKRNSAFALENPYVGLRIHRSTVYE